MAITTGGMLGFAFEIGEKSGLCRILRHGLPVTEWTWRERAEHLLSKQMRQAREGRHDEKMTDNFSMIVRGADKAKLAAGFLIATSAWVEVTPLPFDHYRVACRQDAADRLLALVQPDEYAEDES